MRGARLARTADELTGANVVVGGIESVGIAIAGLLSAALLSRGPGAVFAAANRVGATSVAPMLFETSIAEYVYPNGTYWQGAGALQTSV